MQPLPVDREIQRDDEVQQLLPLIGRESVEQFPHDRIVQVLVPLVVSGGSVHRQKQFLRCLLPVDGRGKGMGIAKQMKPLGFLACYILLFGIFGGGASEVFLENGGEIGLIVESHGVGYLRNIDFALFDETSSLL